MNSQPSKKYRDIHVSANGVMLTGTIQSTEPIKGVVLFAHGVSSSRFSPVNRYVADRITELGLASVLIDLLTPGERTLSKRHSFQANIELIASRLIRISKWIQEDDLFKEYPLGLFGTNISAAAAMSAAVENKAAITALVLSNTRPELIKDYLPQVDAPTLLIAGDKDRAQIQSNQGVMQTLGANHRLEIISGTTHDTHDPSVLEQIADHAGQWFLQQFQSK